MSNSNADRVCDYIHKCTGNKNYVWKDTEKKFNPSILFNNENPVTIDIEKYRELEKVMFMIKTKEQSLVSVIKDIMQGLDKSEGWKEKISRYEVFFHMCEKTIMNIFDSREDAYEYLLLWVQRMNNIRARAEEMVREEIIYCL